MVVCLVRRKPAVVRVAGKSRRGNARRHSSCRAVIASGSQHPITGGSVMLLQQRGGHGEISVGIESFTGLEKRCPW
jgi:hypothetical protein